MISAVGGLVAVGRVDFWPLSLLQSLNVLRSIRWQDSFSVSLESLSTFIAQGWLLARVDSGAH